MKAPKRANYVNQPLLNNTYGLQALEGWLEAVNHKITNSEFSRRAAAKARTLILKIIKDNIK